MKRLTLIIASSLLVSSFDCYLRALLFEFVPLDENVIVEFLVSDDLLLKKCNLTELNIQDQSLLCGKLPNSVNTGHFLLPSITIRDM
jgi:hypothetical protein